MSDANPQTESQVDARELADLIEQLKDERGEYRLKAVNRLKEIGDERAVEPLCAALTDLNPDVRTASARALTRIGDARAVEALCAALKDSYRDARIGAAQALGRIGEARGVAPLCGLLNDTYQDVRTSGADALAKIGSQAVGRLCDVLKDTDQERPAPAKSSGARVATRLDMNLPLRNVKRSARRLAASALGKIGDAGAVEPLCDALGDVDASVRMAAAIALHKTGDYRAVWPLCAALKDSDKQVRAGAARALIAIKNLRAVEPLCGLLKDQDRVVRASAVELLEQIGVIEALPFMVLSDDALSAAERLGALNALSSIWARFGEKSLRVGNVKAFCEGVCATNGVDPNVKRGAEAVLHEANNRAASKQLVRASERSDSHDRQELLRGVTGCSDSSTSNELVRGSNSVPEENVGKRQRVFGKLFKRA